jgi:hypothetical protein
LKKRRRTEEPDENDKKLPKPQYYPQTNIIPSTVPPPLPLRIPLHPFLTKGITWEKIDVLVEEGTLLSVGHEVVAPRK